MLKLLTTLILSLIKIEYLFQVGLLWSNVRVVKIHFVINHNFLIFNSQKNIFVSIKNVHGIKVRKSVWKRLIAIYKACFWNFLIKQQKIIQWKIRMKLHRLIQLKNIFLQIVNKFLRGMMIFRVKWKSVILIIHK